MAFVPGFSAPEGVSDRRLWFGCRGNQVLVRTDNGRPAIPDSVEAAALEPASDWIHFFGLWDGAGCYALWLGEETEAPPGFQWVGLRELFGLLEEGLVWAAGRASQLVHWHVTHRFCGRCGTPTVDHPTERAKLCPRCGLINHPRVTPAIIVAVVRDNRLLLAHATRFVADFYSVLAGFVEPGESLEECVQREVLEEVGVRVRNIRYFASQPWPFPDSLMVAFTADYEGGEIRVDGEEVSDAAWYSADRLPPIPPPLSVARRLIDWFVETHPGCAK